MQSINPPIDVLFDMETSDPDDVLTLCLLIAHPKVNLRAVTVTPGTDEQIGLVKHILKITHHTTIPVGSYAIGYPKNCVSGFHYRWLGHFPEAKPDGVGYQIIQQALQHYPKITVITGGPLKNFSQFGKELPIKRWVGQGGFAGDNIVPESHRLEKFAGKLTCPTFNFNGCIPGAFNLLANPHIAARILVSKNVCHGVTYDAAFHEYMAKFKDTHIGYQLIYSGMQTYLKKRKRGKKLHDPLAACVAIDPTICQFKEVELYRKKGAWGANEKVGSKTHISISVDKERFWSVFVGG